MSVRIDIEQIRSVLEGPVYLVYTAVVYNSGIDRNIFVFNAATEAFAHVATPWDLENTPTDRQTALNTAVDYYRLSAVTREGDEIEEAIAHAVYTLDRIGALARSYELAADTFAGSTTHSYTGS